MHCIALTFQTWSRSSSWVQVQGQKCSESRPKPGRQSDHRAGNRTAAEIMTEAAASQTIRFTCAAESSRAVYGATQHRVVTKQLATQKRWCRASERASASKTCSVPK